MKQMYLALSTALLLAVMLMGCSANREMDSAAPIKPTNTLTSDDDGRVKASDMPSAGDNVIDDIGDAAGDMARGARNAVRDAGNAVGNAASNAGRAMR